VTSGGAGAPLRAILATVGAFVSVLAIYVGDEPGPLSFARLNGTSLSAVVVFAVFTAGGLWVLRTASASAWRWAAGIGVVMATAQLVGMSLRRFGSSSALLLTENLAWVILHWFGTAWMVTGVLAALIQALDVHALRSSDDVTREERPRRFGRLVAALRAPEPARRRTALLLVMGVLVLSRVPYLVVYWPGLVYFDAMRSYAYARGTSPWETYEPVGHSMLITVMQWSGTALGWGDVGGVAIGSISVILASSAAFTFMLGRMAVWGVRPGIWAAGFGWVVLLPVFGYFSVVVVKDVPFSIAMVVFLVCIGELAFGGPDAVRKLWPWVILTVAGIFAIGLRNNGIHVMALCVPLLLVPLRHLWKRILIVSAVLAAAYALYVGPVYATLKVQPGPREESYSVPLQQLGRIATYHWTDLSAADRLFITGVFSGKPQEDLARGYVPWLADPMKLSARQAWGERSTTEFFTGWSRIVGQYPGTAIEATLANTVGYWDPEAASYDGLVRWSSNDVRRVHLDIPSGQPTTGAAAAIESSGFMPTKTYQDGLLDDGYRAIPVLGLAMSPAPVCWLWLIAALLVIRRRDLRALAVFVPIGVLLLTFLAGPVSGGQRYSLTLFMAVPLALGAVVLAKRPGDESSEEPARATAEEDAEQDPAQPASPDDSGPDIIRVPPSDPHSAHAKPDERALSSR
jgi:hypothetical protein